MGRRREEMDDRATPETYSAEQVVVCLMNLRAQLYRMEFDEVERRGADRALTMAIEDWRALIDGEDRVEKEATAREPGGTG
jgi:hypothetical protein